MYYLFCATAHHRSSLPVLSINYPLTHWYCPMKTTCLIENDLSVAYNKALNNLPLNILGQKYLGLWGQPKINSAV